MFSVLIPSKHPGIRNRDDGISGEHTGLGIGSPRGGAVRNSDHIHHRRSPKEGTLAGVGRVQARTCGRHFSAALQSRAMDRLHL